MCSFLRYNKSVKQKDFTDVSLGSCVNFMRKDLHNSILLDAYGGLLTDKQYIAMKYYYDDDLSLSEISENCNITRQGVRDLIKNAEKKLLYFDSKLQFVSNVEKFSDVISSIYEILSELKKTKDFKKLDEAMTLCERQLKENSLMGGE